MNLLLVRGFGEDGRLEWDLAVVQARRIKVEILERHFVLIGFGKLWTRHVKQRRENRIKFIFWFRLRSTYINLSPRHREISIRRLTTVDVLEDLVHAFQPCHFVDLLRLDVVLADQREARAPVDVLLSNKIYFYIRLSIWKLAKRKSEEINKFSFVSGLKKLSKFSSLIFFYGEKDRKRLKVG